jgi:HlyD family secretion protein
MKRWLVVIIVIAILAGGFFAFRAYSQSRREASLAELQTVEVAYGPLVATVGATGTVRTNQFTVLTFAASGTVGTVTAALGDQVRVDEVLAELKQTSLPSQVILAQADLVSAQRALDDLLYSDQERAAAQQALAQAEDALKDAEYMLRVRQAGNRASNDTLDATRANLVMAEYEVERAQDEFNAVSGRPDDDPIRALALSNLAAARQKRDSILRNLNWYTGHPTELEQALLDADVAAAEARLADAKREWERLKDGPDPEDIASAEARVAAAQASVELSMIKAPFSGTITSVEIKPGDQVTAGTPAFGLADLSHLFVDVDVSEIDINRVRVGQTVTLSFDAVLDKTYQGEVVEIGLTGNVVQGVVNFRVTVELGDPDEFIKPGMTAAVNVLVSQIEDVLLVPNRAVRIRDGQRVVYVLRDGMLAQVEIELGVSSEMYSQVLDGDLQEGDLIVINPPVVFDTQGGPPSFVGHP